MGEQFYEAADLTRYMQMVARLQAECDEARLKRGEAVAAATEARQRAERMRDLLQVIVDKATPFGEIDEPGGPYIRSYLLPTGPIHRALAFLRGSVSAADQPAKAGGEVGCDHRPEKQRFDGNVWVCECGERDI